MKTLQANIETLEDRLFLSGDAPVINSLNTLESTDGRIAAIVASFSEDVSASLDASDLVLQNADTLDVVNTSAAQLFVDGTTATWTFIFMPGGSLPDANYIGSLTASGISDADSNALDGDGDGTGGDDYQFSFASFGDITLSGRVYGDANSDQSYTAGSDVQMAGYTVYLDIDLDGQFDASEPSAVTDSTGSWTMAGLTPGDYRVTVDAGGSWQITAPAAGYYDISTVSDEVATGLDLGIYLPDSISGRIFQDIDGDAIQDSDEDGISSMVVYIDANENGQLDTGETQTTTDSRGDYIFTDLAAGSYRIAIAASSTWTIIDPAAGRYAVTLSGSDAAMARNFALQSSGTSISGSVYIDSDNDGSFDTGETPLSGWVVFLDANADGLLGLGESWVLSAADGSYSFSDLAAGDYIVAANALSGWDATSPVGAVSGTVGLTQVLSVGDTGLGQMQRTVASRQSPDGAFVYSAARGDGSWSLFAFAVDGATGELTLVQQLPEANYPSLNGVCDVVFSDDGNFAYVASSLAGSVSVFSRDIHTGQMSFITALSYSDDNLSALDGASSLTISDDGAYIYVTGASADSVVVFERDAVTGQLSLVASYSDGDLGMDGLAAAADSVLSGDGRFLYVASVTEAAITVFARNSTTGKLSYQMSVNASDIPGGSLSYLASLAVSPDGDYLYAVASGSGSLVIFSRDSVSGALAYADKFTNLSGGVIGMEYPTDVAVSPDGTQVVVTGSIGYSFAEFARDDSGHSFVQAVADDYNSSLFPDIRTVEFSPDGRRLYLSGATGSQVMVYSYQAYQAHTASLDTGEAASSVDFGFVAQSANVSGYIWLDSNNNGIKEAGENPLAGWTLYLDGGQYRSSGISVQSDATGAYSFENLPTGVHLITLATPEGWVITSENGEALLVDVSSGDDLTGINFGVVMPAGISGSVFEDADRDGNWDLGEAGLAGALVFIDENQNGVADTGEPQQYCDSSGNFSFDSLSAGVYRVAVVYPSGMVASEPIDGAYSIVLAAGEQVTDLQFSAYNLGNISGKLFHDINGNGIQDGGEEDLSGWQVYIDADGDATHDAAEPVVTTDADGSYIFENLAPGSYNLRVVTGDSWQAVGLGDTPLATVLPSGQSVSGANFAMAQWVSISGAVYHDNEGNLLFDDGDLALSGWQVYIDADNDGQLDIDETVATTTADGSYVFNRLDPGSYSVAAVLGAGWAASGEISSYSQMQTISGQAIENADFGLRPMVAFDRTTRGVYTDPDGVKIVVNSNRLSSGRIYIDTEGYVIELCADSADGRGDVTVDIVGAGQLFISIINIPGSVTSLIAPKLDLTDGTLNADGSLERLRLGDVSGSQLNFNQNLADGEIPQDMDVTLGRVSDSSLDTGSGEIDQLTAIEWLDTDDIEDAISAAAIDVMEITGERASGALPASSGDMQANVSLGGADAADSGSLARADIAGNVTGTWDLTGDADRITLSGPAEDFVLNVGGSGSSLRAGELRSADINYGGTLGDILAEQWASGSLRADSVSSVRITGNRAEDIAGDMGADIDLPGVYLDSGSDSLGRMDVAGSVTGGSWNMAESAGQINVAGDIAGLTVAIGSQLDALTAASVTDTALSAGDSVGRIIVDQWLGGTIAADTLEQLRTTGDRDAELAGDFSPDMQLTANTPLRGDWAIKVIDIAGDILGGSWDFDSGLSDLGVAGDIGQLTADIAGEIANVSADEIAETDITATGGIDRIIASQWLGGSLAADSITLLKITGDRRNDIPGDLSADMALAGQNLDRNDQALRQLVIAGDLSDSQWDISGGVRSLNLSGDVSGVTFNLTGDMDSFSAASVSESDLNVSGDCGSVTAVEWLGGSINADSVRFIKTLGSRAEDIAGDFSGDITLGDAQSPSDNVLLKQLSVAGDAGDVQWVISGDASAIIIGGDVSNMDAQLTGQLDSLIAGNVTDSTLSSDQLIVLVDVLSWLGGEINAASLNKLLAGHHSLRGEDVFSADVILGSGGLAAGGRTLGSASVQGNIPSGSWQLGTGDSGDIAVDGDITDWSLTAGDVSSLRGYSVSNSTVTASGDMGNVSSDQWTDGSIAAASMNVFKTTGNRADDIAGDFTGDLDIAGDLSKVLVAGSSDGVSWQADGALRAIEVAGDISNSDIACGDEIGETLGKISVIGIADNIQVYCSSTINNILLGACYSSDFLAGVDVSVQRRAVEYSDHFIDSDAFIGAMKINGVKVAAGESDRFISDSNFSAPRVVAATIRQPSQDDMNIGFFVDTSGRQIQGMAYRDTLQKNWNWNSRRGDVPGSGNVYVTPVGEAYRPAVSVSSLDVNEGATAAVSVALSSDPIFETTVSVTWQSGDSDLAVSGVSEFTFDSSNWDQPQLVSFFAAEDTDSASGYADFSFSASGGIEDVTLRVNEVDDDTPFDILLSDSAVQVNEGSAVQLGVTLSMAPLATVVASVSYTSGDSDISITFGQTLVFDWSNWSTAHVILISAASDVDLLNGSATFTISAIGAAFDVSFTVTEIDAG